MASDPDADRVGISCKDDKGEWVLINGNQTCLMYLYYIITQYKALNKIKGDEFVVKTIVTTELIKTIADRNKIEMLDCYTGFKWIAREIRLLEGKKTYIGGGEESYGFLCEDFVRDKDAVSSCALMAEITAWARSKGKSLFELLQDIYLEYGFSREKMKYVVRKGQAGAEEIRQLMVRFRNNPPAALGGSPLMIVKDYESLQEKNLLTGEVKPIAQKTTSDVLQFFTQAGTKISVRPSGTEPKIKFYFEVRGELTSRDGYDQAEARADELIETMMAEMGLA